MKKYLIGVTFLLVFKILSGQCPDKILLWKRIVYLRDSTESVPEKVQLKELREAEKKIASCSDNNDSTSALLLSRIGVLYYFQSDYINALNYTKRAISIIQTNKGKPAVNEKHLIRSYNNLRNYYDSLGRVRDKMESTDSCLAIAIRTKSIDRTAMSNFVQKINYLYDVGDYHPCLEYIDLAERLNSAYFNGRDSTINAIYLIISRVNNLLLLKEYDKVRIILNDKFKIFDDRKNNTYVALIYTLMGRLSVETGNYKKALSGYKKAIPGFLKDSAITSYIELMNNIGYLYFLHLGNPDSALTYYRIALSYLRTYRSTLNNNSLEPLNVLANMANAYVTKNNFDSAYYYYQAAFNELKPGMNERLLLSAPENEQILYANSNYLSALIADKANAYLSQYKVQKKPELLQNAISLFKTYDQLLEKVKTLHTEVTTKLFWRRDTRKFYEQAIEACYLAGSKSDAFYFFEKSRAVLLNDQLKRQKWMNESEILQEAQIRKNILALSNERSNPENVSRYSQIEQDLMVQKQELARLENSIKTNNPFYYQSFFDSSFIGIDDVRGSLLKDHQAIIESFSGDSAIYFLIITPKDVVLKKINKEEFDTNLVTFTKYLSNHSLLNAHYDEFIKVSSKIYQLIFSNSNIDVGRIIISQDQTYFPFEALVIRNSSNPEFLVNDYAVSYAYSCRYLMNEFETRHKGTKRDFIGVAPIKFTSVQRLTTLTGSDRSLAKLSGFFRNSDEFRDGAATKRAFLDQFSDYKIVQLYTHASDTSANGEPVIFFADSALYLSELIREEVPAARLIVLSACETGLGELYKGEGVFSFNRGFAAMGIPAAITTLWSVEADATYSITESFYKFLSEGHPTDVALQKAKLEFLKTASKEKSLPYFWAGPILSGKAEKIEFSKRNYWKWIGVGVGLLFIVIVIFVISRRARSKAS